MILVFPAPKATFFCAKDLICSLTTSIPLSSDAFSSNVASLNCPSSNSRTMHSTLDVLPTPGGPARMRLGMVPWATQARRVLICSTLPQTSLRVLGRYFSSQIYFMALILQSLRFKPPFPLQNSHGWARIVINLLGIIVLVIVILMMQGRQKQSMNKLSPLFVDTEFVPTGFPFFTLYNRRVSNIPGVLPYSPEQTFQQLQQKITTSKIPSSRFTSSIKDYKIQAYRKNIVGEELELGPDGNILQPRGQSEDNQSKDRCEICCVMMASKNEVLRLQIQRREEKYMQEQILAEVNHKFQSKLSIGDLRFNSLSFSITTASGTPANIIYDPTPVSKLSEIILASERVSFVGIDIITNSVSASMLFNQEDQVVSVIDVQSGRLLHITDLIKRVDFMLEYQKIKQYRVDEVLEIIGVENAKAKGLKLIEKVFKPTQLIYTMKYFYDDNALINFLNAVVVDQNEVIAQAIKDLPLLAESELITLAGEQQGKIRGKMNSLSFFCSELEPMPEKNLFRPSYHVINKYIRNYFTHTNNYIKESIYARLTKGLYSQLNNLPTYEGTVYRKVNFELTHKVKDVVDFSCFVVATADPTLLSLGGNPLYRTRNTVITIISKTGRKIGSESSFNNLEEVIFLPFTKFSVTSRSQDNNTINITLQQLRTEAKQSISYIILWLDQKPQEAKRFYEQKLQKLSTSIHLNCLQSTQDFINWIDDNQRYVQSLAANIIVITNMFRLENGRENPNAGAEAILAGRQRLPKAKYIVYIGNYEKALKILDNKKIKSESLHITTDPELLASYLCNEFDASNRKKLPPPQPYRLPTQDWLDFFPQLQQQPIYGKGAQQIKPKQKEKMQGFGPKYPQKSSQKQKDYNLPLQQEKGYQLADNPPAKTLRLINQPKPPFPASVQPPKKPQGYNDYLANQPKEAQFSQPMKPAFSVSAIFASAEEDDNPADRFKVKKDLIGSKMDSQSNLYKIPGPMSSKIASSTIPAASSKIGKP